MINASLALNIDPNRAPEYAEPQHDYILVREMTEHVSISRGGVFMPDVNDPTGNKRAGARFEVMAVGPGPWTDRVTAGEKDGAPTAIGSRFMRRPMTVKEGDQVVFQGGGFLVNTDGGGQLIAIQDYQIVAIYRRKA
jgi:co-chaperonin GroES (HSP10)